MKLTRAAFLWTIALCMGCRGNILTLEMQSDREYIGGGQNYSLIYDSTQGSFLTAYVGVTGDGVPVIVDLRADYAVPLLRDTNALLEFSAQGMPGGLALGSFSGAQRWPFQPPGSPGLSVGFDARGCNNITGSFTVTELRYEQTANLPLLLGFSATFEQYCDFYTTPLRGTLRYDYYERVPDPHLIVESAPGSSLSSGTLFGFGYTAVGASATREIILRNTGALDLTGLEATIDPGGNAGDFTFTPLPVSTLGFGETTRFQVTITPSGSGIREATLRIASSDPSQGPFTLQLSGGLPNPLEAWRLDYFGTSHGEGDAADMNDPDQDGVVNLMEFAMNTDPRWPLEQHGEFSWNDGAFQFNYFRRSGSTAILKYDWEFSNSLTGPWTATGETAETILIDSDYQSVKVTMPPGNRFMRLKVSKR